MLIFEPSAKMDTRSSSEYCVCAETLVKGYIGYIIGIKMTGEIYIIYNRPPSLLELLSELIIGYIIGGLPIKPSLFLQSRIEK